MDLPWGDERTKKFVTNVGLITSNGPYGYDIMAAEWTHHVSYSPGMIAVCINSKSATNANIKRTKEFGVGLCAFDQNVLSSVAGGSSGKNVNKIEALKELGFEFFKAKKINVLMAEGAAMNAECRLHKKIELGSYTAFVGEVVWLYPGNEKEPLVYHGQKYFKLGEIMQKPSQGEMDRIKSIVEKHGREGVKK